VKCMAGRAKAGRVPAGRQRFYTPVNEQEVLTIKRFNIPAMAVLMFALTGGTEYFVHSWR
jgi:hypothetical protein